MDKQEGNTGRRQNMSPTGCDSSPPPGRRDLTPWKKGRDGGGLRRRIKEWMWDGDRGWRRAGRKAGRQTTLEEVRAEDGHPGGGRLTESRVEMEGAREETGGARADQMEGGARTMEATVTMVAHGGADGGRSHGGGMAADSRGPTNGGGAGGGGARGSDREPKSQDEAEDLEGQGGAGGFGD